MKKYLITEYKYLESTQTRGNNPTEAALLQQANKLT